MQTPSTCRWRRGAMALVMALLVAATAPTGAAGAAATVDPEDWGPRRADRTDRSDAAPADVPSTQIVGGTIAPPGAHPSQAALVYAGSVAVRGQFCGGTVIDRSWILTAAHCVKDPSTQWVPRAAEIEVLVGTQDLRAGGTRIRVAEIRVHPLWDRQLIRNDIALLRLDRPVPPGVPIQPLARPGAPAPAPGTLETAVGWGDLADASGTYPPDLREVDLRAQAPRTCEDVFGAGYFSATASLCAWAQDRGTCQGDSGGPLLVAGVQVGVVSYGAICGEHPSVFARVSTFSGWVADQVRYGAHPDANAFVRRMYLDAYDRQPTDRELFTGVAQLHDGQRPDVFAHDVLAQRAYQGPTGGIVRLYRAVLQRRPDTGGMRYWWGRVNRGVSLTRIATIMVAGQEVQAEYGALDDSAFVDRVYENVLHRDPSPSDLAFWVGELGSGRRTRGGVMVGFSESAELKRATAADTSVIVTFFGLLRRTPAEGDIGFWRSRSSQSLVSTIVRGFEYAYRF